MKNVSKLLSILLCLAMVVGIFAMTASAATDHVVINEVYGGGGNNSSAYKYDFVELYNPTSSSVSLAGMTLQYTSKTGTFGSNIFTFPSSATIAAGGYYLVRMAAGSNDTGDITNHDAEGTFAMGAKEFKIALVSNADAITGKNDPDVIDFLGAGGANEYEGSSAAPTLSNSTSASRKTAGADTDNNSADFEAVAPSPKGSANNPGAPTVNVTGVSLDQTTATVEVGASVSLTANVDPNNATNKTVTWTSSNNAVATVSNGKVTGVKAGTATITAKTEDGNKTATCAVTVTARPTIADGQYIIWNPGNNKALSSNAAATYYRSGVDVTLSGSTLTGYGATEIWTVTNNNDGTITIATQDGKKLSLGTSHSSTPFDDVNDKWVLNTAAEGQYYIKNVGRPEQVLEWYASKDYFSTYTSASVKDYGFTFTKYTPPAVLVPATSVTLNETSGTLEVDETITLTATVAPSNTTDTLITWTSSDESVATVSNGKVKALKAGTATITAKAGDVTATFALTVTAPTVPTGAIDSLDKLVTGTYVLVVDTGYAPTVLDGTWFMSAQPTIAEGKVSDAKGTVLKLVVKDGKATIKDANGKIFATGNKNEAGTADAFEWDVKFENNRFTFTSGEGDDTRYLASAISYDNKFRTYKASTFAGNPEGYAYKFSIYAAEAPAGDKTPSQTGDAFEPMVIVLALAAVSALAVLALNKKKFSF